MPSVVRAFVVVLAVAGTLAGRAAAQAAKSAPPSWSREQVLAHLGSEEPREVAWAAYFAAENDLREAAPALLAALPRMVGKEHSEPVRLQLLDALLRLDAEVPGTELLPHATGLLRVPALLLAAKQPAANRAYFEARMAALAGSEDLEWRVCGNQLAAMGGRGFVAHCLQHLQYELDLTVFDDPQARSTH